MLREIGPASSRCSQMAVDDSRIPGESSLHVGYRGQRGYSWAKCLLSVEREHVPNTEPRNISKCTCRKLN